MIMFEKNKIINL